MSFYLMNIEHKCIQSSICRIFFLSFLLHLKYFVYLNKKHLYFFVIFPKNLFRWFTFINRKPKTEILTKGKNKNHLFFYLPTSQVKWLFSSNFGVTRKNYKRWGNFFVLWDAHWSTTCNARFIFQRLSILNRLILLYPWVVFFLIDLIRLGYVFI